MCRFNWHFPGDDGPGCPLAQPLPQIEWAVPVDMTRLGASLEAYSRLETSITTLRLCHRFCQAPLSKLPQELLEHIIDEAHQAEIQETLEDWVSNQERECFQGLCKPEDHYEPYGPHTERVWQSLFGARDDEAVRDPTTYSEKEKVDMVVGFLSDSPTIHYDLDGWELHELRAAAWLDRVCTCASGAFRPLNDILKSKFGLNAIVLHEVLSPQIVAFLPSSFEDQEFPFHTLCYLVPCTNGRGNNRQGRKATYRQRLFAEKGDHSSFRQAINPVLTEDVRLRFAKAMRILDVKPHYDIIEIEPLISPSIVDSDLLKICPCFDATCPCSKTKTVGRPSLLARYLKQQNEELARQSWPQLMCLSASDTVSPSEEH